MNSSCVARLVFCVVVTTGWLWSAPPKPNILILFTDDQSFETIRALGNTEIDTPHLDTLVARGTTFTRAYNMGSFVPAVCVASRAMLMTGRSLWQSKRVYDNLDAERLAGHLWPQMLARVGYRTYFSGKWHLPTDATRVFDVVSHVRPGMPKTNPEAYNRPLAGEPGPWSPSAEKWGGYWEGGKHWSEVTADDAIGFLDEAAKRPEPFFLYAAFNAPHDPRQAPQAYVDRYPPSRISVPRNFLPEYPHNEVMDAGRSLRDERLAPFPRTPEAVRVHRGEYYALITHLDEQIGRVLAALERSGKADSTWIFLTADQGLAVGHHGLFGKQNMYEHSLRVPFILIGPGAPRGRRIDSPIYLQDMMATTLELAGVEKPAQVFFHSLLPFLDEAEPASQYPEIYGAYREQQRAIVHGDYKLIQYPAGGIIRLFNLKDDPDEMKDLANSASHRALAKDLLARLHRLQETMDDPLTKP